MAGIYIHIPFCEHKCIYCDFYSVESLGQVDRFLRALRSEIALAASAGMSERIGTIYFGGGTPSLLSAEQVGRILQDIRATYRVDADAEITLEANPGTVETRKLGGFRQAGINRVSFGVQSFKEEDLRFLTRIHSSEEARRSVRAARSVGFENVSIDLIFALPGQTMAGWKENLVEAVGLEPQHISAYSLLVERGTPLARMVAAREVRPQKIEAEAAMYEMTMEFLRGAGYDHYEVSNYALPGFRSRHNSNYWNHTTYLGFGPSAHSFQSGRRWWNVSGITQYCVMLEEGRIPLVGEEQLTPGALLDEAVMLGLRCGEIDLTLLKKLHGVDLLVGNHRVVDEMLRQDLAVLDDRLLRLTPKGFLLCDAISERLLAGIPSA